MQTVQQRFLKNVKHNDFSGAGTSVFHIKNYKFPTHEQMDQFKKHHIPFDADLALRDLIIELNNKGYGTAGSCSGHVQGRRGFITFGLTDSDIQDLVTRETSRGTFKTQKERNDYYNGLLGWYKKYYGGGRKKFNKDEVIEICKKHGLKRIRFEPRSKNRPFYSISFSSIVVKNKYG